MILKKVLVKILSLFTIEEWLYTQLLQWWVYLVFYLKYWYKYIWHMLTFSFNPFWNGARTYIIVFEPNYLVNDFFLLPNVVVFTSIKEKREKLKITSHPFSLLIISLLFLLIRDFADLLGFPRWIWMISIALALTVITSPQHLRIDQLSWPLIISHWLEFWLTISPRFNTTTAWLKMNYINTY